MVQYDRLLRRGGGKQLFGIGTDSAFPRNDDWQRSVSVPETSPCRRAVHSIRWGRCPSSGQTRPHSGLCRCGGSQSSHVCQRIRTGGQSNVNGVRDFATDERSGSKPSSFRSSAWSPVMCPSSAASSPGRSVCERYGSFIVVLPCVILFAVIPANVILASVDPSFPSPAVLVLALRPGSWLRCQELLAVEGPLRPP